MIALWVVLGIVVLLLVYGLVAYNRFVAQRNAIRNAFADTDTELRRRYDLIPNLVETVRGYAAHERGVLEEVTRARSAAMAARGPAEQGQAESVLTAALGRLFAVAEQYPQLRASENFQGLQAEVANTENRIQGRRSFYNDVVRRYNQRVQSVPPNVVARMFGFTEEEFFEIEADRREELQEAPRVDFTGPGGPPAPGG